MAVSAEEAPVIALPVNGGDSKLDVGEGVPLGVAAGSSFEDDPEGAFEPPAIEVMAKAGLALPESPITCHVISFETKHRREGEHLQTII